MKARKPLSDYEELILRRSLPGCPKGSKFKKTEDGIEFFLSVTDEEFLNGLKMYTFTNDEVNRNPAWFTPAK